MAASPPPLKRARTAFESPPRAPAQVTFESPPGAAAAANAANRRFQRCPIPPSPGLALKCSMLQKKPAFPGNNLPIETDPTPLELQNAPERLHTRLIYKDGDTHRNVMKQPNGSKSCWAYSFAMLLTDLKRSGKEFSLNESFHRWFTGSNSLTAEEVQIEAKRLGVELTLTLIPQGNSLRTVSKQLEESGFPVVVTIEHKVFSGHAIVIDKVTDTHTTIRDPFSGKVFVIPNDTMKTYFIDEDSGIESLEEQKCLSVTPVQQQQT